MTTDKAFCSNINCKNMDCERNQEHVHDYNIYIWISDFPDCKEVQE